MTYASKEPDLSAANSSPTTIPARQRPNFLGDALLFLVLLSAPYAIFADHNGILFSFLTLQIAALAIGLACILAAFVNVASQRVIKACLVSVLLFLFFDLHVSPENLSIETGIEAFPLIHGDSLYLVVAALIVIIVMWLRGNMNKILTAIFGTILVSTLLLALPRQFSSSSQSSASTGEPIPGADKSKLPVYVHILLDEHMGIAGFKGSSSNFSNIREDLERFYTGADFRLFSRAYSPFLYTNDSVPAMMNYLAGRAPDDTFIKSNGSEQKDLDSAQYQLLRNAYFDGLRAKGYRLNVYQSRWLDYCAMYRKTIAKCMTYRYTLNRDVVNLFSPVERLQIVFNMYVRKSYLISWMRHLSHLLAKQAAGAPHSGSEPTPWDGWIGPPIAFPALDALNRDLSAAKPGDMFFAHLLLPHHPYTVDASCNIKRPIFTSWSESHTHFLIKTHAVTADERKERYTHYIPQVRCAMHKLTELFSTLKKAGHYDDAIIIIQGDHGSRLYRNEPIKENIPVLTDTDFSDSFSSLFAVKMPGVTPGIDSVMVDLPGLLQQVQDGVLHSGQPVKGPTNPVAMIYDATRGSTNKKVMYPLSMPAFPLNSPPGR